MNQVICISNSKGGVGKTTTALNLSAGLTMLGAKVLAIDADPQADLTAHMGWTRADELEITLNSKLRDVLMENGEDPLKGILHHPEGIDLLPSNLELSSMEMNLINAMSRETVLRSYVNEVRDKYDFIIIDCQPSLGMVSLNALTSADSVIIPVQAEYFALEGISKLLNTIKIIKTKLNPKLQIEGFLLTMYDARLRLANQIYEEVKRHFQNLVFDTVIQRNIRLSEAPSFGLPALLYSPDSKGSQNYMSLARELLAKHHDTIKN